MGCEIERKFLVEGDAWRVQSVDSRRLRQGYLAIEDGVTVRVRCDGEKGFVTIKGATSGISRPEFEYVIPREDAEELLLLCRGRTVEKMRHRIPAGNRTWEVDEFSGANSGLVMAEIELADENEAFERPAWLGHEVSGDARYYNANLALRPMGKADPHRRRMMPANRSQFRHSRVQGA